MLGVGSSPAGAAGLSSLRSQAAQATARLGTLTLDVGIANERYDQALLRYRQVSGELSAVRTRIVAARSEVARDEAELRAEAITAYTTGGASGVDAVFSIPSLRASVAKEYLAVSSGDITQSVETLQRAQAGLRSLRATLAVENAQAGAALADAAAARRSGAQAQAGASSLLAGLKGRIAGLVSAQQAANQAANQAALEAHLGASAGLPAGQGAATAIRAAESQIGVPYQWGGATPGVGFDCSGLTMWAWGQAGVSLTHSAAAQYNEVAHVPLSAIQPGDLLFWASNGYIYHVAMYIGNGEMVDAPRPGQSVQNQPVWYNGLIGAGRP